jgi:16S rRNA (adenine1518-N6/adenine1519-N6)-dimethyltransferase
MSRPKKRFGQHFLTDPRLLARIAAALEAPPGTTVLEIGPGRGALTAALLAAGFRVTAIEKDADLWEGLRARFPDLALVEGDALEIDWHAVAPGALVIGNIPYNVTSPLVDKALQPPRPARIVYLVQKEVALRLAAAPGSDDYGALTVGVQAVAHVERLFTVAAGAFTPPPKVDSAVVRLVPRTDPLVADAEITAFRSLVVGLFGYRRKTLLRGLRELTGWAAPEAAAALDAAKIDGTVRPETLAPTAFVRLLRACVDAGWSGR